MRWLFSSLKILTGTQVRSASEANAVIEPPFPCRLMSGRRSPRTCAKDGRAAPVVACFCAAKLPSAAFLGQCGVGSIVRHALQRAGIQAPTKGAHQFRHALATQMLRHGASLTEIGDVLRHRSPQTTTIYAKVDLKALRTLALPWPGGVR